MSTMGQMEAPRSKRRPHSSDMCVFTTRLTQMEFMADFVLRNWPVL